VKWIYSNYHRELTVQEAAGQINMSPQAFTLYFKKTTGQTFLKFINQLRISKACEQLLTTDDDITSIAFRNGFNNLSNFNRRFKQIKKMSPREFRNSSKPS
jgi:AraC-like DNA-binding protein